MCASRVRRACASRVCATSPQRGGGRVRTKGKGRLARSCTRCLISSTVPIARRSAVLSRALSRAVLSRAARSFSPSPPRFSRSTGKPAGRYLRMKASNMGRSG